MIQLPEFNRSFDYENGFYLSCDSSRIAKFLAHYELFKMVQEVPGAIVECGVFKGVSLTRFAMLRELFGPGYARTLVGFDIFGRFRKPPLSQIELRENSSSMPLAMRVFQSSK